MLGLDGVPWRLLDRWTENGELPNLARIVEEGAVGPLESTMPPTTAIAWPSIATGVGPDRHGLYSFRRLTAQYGHEVNTSAERRSPALWDVHSPATVANVPMTYPAQVLDGTLVAGMMTPEIGDGFTHPPEFADEISRDIPDYRIGLSWHDYYDREREFLADLADLLSARRELMRKLMEREDWRLFFFVYTEPDRLQHLIWDEAVILEHYQELDDIVGEVMAYVEERDATLYVASDHGFGPIDRLVHVNRALEEYGLLTRQGGGKRGVLETAGITKENLLGILDRLGFDEAFLEALPSAVLDRIASSVPGGHGLYDVDFSNTRAFVYGTRCVYVNDTDRFEEGTVRPEEIESVKAKVRAAFADVTDPETGEAILEVYDGDDLFPADPDSPDLVVHAAAGYLADTALATEVFAPGDRDGAHEPEGIFLAWGPHVKAGARTRAATVFDVAPTLLHGVGKPIPETTAGRVLEEICEDDSPPARRPIETRAYADPDERAAIDADFEEVEGRLRGLGYIE